MAKTEITSEDRIKLIGLTEIARQHVRSLKTIERAMAEIVHEGTGLLDDYYGHVSDHVWGELYEVDMLLEKLEVKVIDKNCNCNSDCNCNGVEKSV